MQLPVEVGAVGESFFWGTPHQLALCFKERGLKRSIQCDHWLGSPSDRWAYAGQAEGSTLITAYLEGKLICKQCPQIVHWVWEHPGWEVWGKLCWCGIPGWVCSCLKLWGCLHLSIAPTPYTHAGPTGSTEGELDQRAGGNSPSFHLLPEKSAAQTQWGFFWLKRICCLTIS